MRGSSEGPVWARLLRTARRAPSSYGAPSVGTASPSGGRASVGTASPSGGRVSVGTASLFALSAIFALGCGSGRGSEGPPPEEHASNPGCIDCHVDDYKGAHGHVDVKPKRCEVCHREDHWHPIQRKHDWPLTGAHEKADCLACHTGKHPVYEGASRECISCHRAEFDAQNAKSPEHARSSEACDKCHSTNDWAEWPGHAKTAEPPPVAIPTAPTATATATATASTSKPVSPKRPTPRPKPTVTATGTATTPTSTPTATVPPIPTTTIPPIITGASHRR